MWFNIHLIIQFWEYTKFGREFTQFMAKSLNIYENSLSLVEDITPYNFENAHTKFG